MEKARRGRWYICFKEAVTAIQQGEALEFPESLSPIEPQAYSLKVSGSGSLSVEDYGLEPPSISTDGAFIMESGTLKSGDTSENCFSLSTQEILFYQAMRLKTKLLKAMATVCLGQRILLQESK